MRKFSQIKESKGFTKSDTEKVYYTDYSDYSDEEKEILKDNTDAYTNGHADLITVYDEEGGDLMDLLKSKGFSGGDKGIFRRR